MISQKSSITFEFIRPNVFHFIPRGKISENEVINTAKAVGELLTGNKNLYFIASVSDLQSYPLKIRKFVFDWFDNAFANGVIRHVYLVSPSLFVRVMFGLVINFYKRISLSICDSVEDALHEIDQEVDTALTIEQVRVALESKTSQPGFQILHYSIEQFNEDESCTVETFIIGPNIIYVKLVGRMGQKAFKLIYHDLELANKLANGPVHYIANLKFVKGLNSEAKRYFVEESKWHDHQMIHKYFEVSPMIKALMRIFSFVNRKYIQTTSVINDHAECITGLLTEPNSPKRSQPVDVTNLELNKDVLADFTRDELIEYLLASHRDNKELRAMINSRVESIYKVISNITWKEDFKTMKLESLAEEDPFNEVFLSINILQADVGEMIDKLRTLNNNLESEVQLRTRELVHSKIELEEQNRQLQKINHELDTFIYRSSHDMRAPLASIQGLIDLVGRERDPEVMKSYLGYMYKTTRRMDELLREITDLTKNTKFELHFQNIDFFQLVENSIEQLGFSFPLHQIEIRKSIQQSSSFISDSFRLQLIFINLISNSIKYKRTGIHSEIEISVKADSESANIFISDNGQGIESKYLPYVFNMFYRANEKSSGSGLGLYMVKEAVSKLNGTISIESEIGKNTRVTISISNVKHPN